MATNNRYACTWPMSAFANQLRDECNPEDLKDKLQEEDTSGFYTIPMRILINVTQQENFLEDFIHRYNSALSQDKQSPLSIFIITKTGKIIKDYQQKLLAQSSSSAASSSESNSSDALKLETTKKILNKIFADHECRAAKVLLEWMREYWQSLTIQKHQTHTTQATASSQDRAKPTVEKAAATEKSAAKLKDASSSLQQQAHELNNNGESQDKDEGSDSDKACRLM